MVRFFKRMMALANMGIAVAVAVILVYRQLVRPWHVRWGASDDEVARPMPGDDLVADANLQTTRALTIAAPPQEVWPWLAQLGQGRGGFYSYDLLENLAGLDMHSANRILPEYQELAVGDIIAIEPEGGGYRIAEIEPNRLLLLYLDGEGEGAVADHFRDANAASTWTFVLKPLGSERTRLVVRWRARYPTFGSHNTIAAVLGPILEPVEFVMERKMLKGIRERAELRTG